MAELYKKVGRGGAGNFYSKKNAESPINRGDDIESQTSSQTSSQETTNLARALTSSKLPPEYLHTGRGGAGNWVQPSELSAQGLEQIASPDPTSPSNPSNTNVSVSKRVLGGSKPSYRGGRGGAGNYTDFAEEERLKKEAEERTRAETEERITRDVEAGLSKPPRAYGGRGGAWEMGSLE